MVLHRPEGGGGARFGGICFGNCKLYTRLTVSMCRIRIHSNSIIHYYYSIIKIFKTYRLINYIVSLQLQQIIPTNLQTGIDHQTTNPACFKQFYN
jgi:hypothetical protein